jgi:hypothetical protein
MKTKQRMLIALSLLLTLAGGAYPARTQTVEAAAAALGEPSAQMAPSTVDTAGGENADWWAAVQEDVRRSEYHITWQEQTYLADATAGAYQAPNRAQNLRTYFSGEGLTVIPRVWPEVGEVPPWRWELSLSAWGRTSAPVAELYAQENRIEYRRGGPPASSGQSLVEWYVNDENGLEQGFTLAAPPAEASNGKPLRIDFLVGGNLVGSALHDGTAIEFLAPDGKDGLCYGSLQAVDAAGRSRPAWLSLQGAALSLFVDDAEAVYPIQIDLTITGLSEDWDWRTVAPDPAGLDAYLGYSVATAGDINGDGYSDVIIGAPCYDWGETNEGVVIAVYGSSTGLRSETVQHLQQDQAHAYFGQSVAPAGDVNGDGYGDVIVGTPYWDDGEATEGGAWIYLGSALGLNPTPWYQDGGQVGAQFGWSVATAGDVNKDGYSDVIIGAPAYNNGQTDEGRVYVWYGSDGDIFAQPHDWRAESNQADAWFGHSVGTAGDVNGDGYSDIIVGAPYYDNGETDEGAAFAWYGSADGLNDGTHGDPSNAAWMAQGNQADAWLGYSVSTAGDVNGDGRSDVIVGGPLFDNGQEDEGAAWVFFGSSAGLETTWASRKESNQIGAGLGHSVHTAGDVNGDGYTDIVTGAPYYDTGETDAGRAWVWYGSSSGPSALSDWRDDGGWQDAYFGWSVAPAGDVNGDGYSDVIVGAPGKSYAGLVGYVNVYHGGPSPLSDTPGWSRDSNQETAFFGWSLDTAGDVNGDGYADIIVGAPFWDGGEEDEGKVWVYYGGYDGPSVTSDWSAERDQAGAQFGYSVSTAGDVDGDGYDDVIVGAPMYDNDYQDEGLIFVYYGSDEGLSAGSYWAMGRFQTGARFGASVGTAGDVNGDGYSDIIVGAPLWDNGQGGEGSAYVYHGSADGFHRVLSDWYVWFDEEGQYGYAVSTAGDVNGDGYSDVIVGAPYWDHGQDQEGGAWVYLGSRDGLNVTWDWRQDGHQANARLGWSVSTAGDVDGDGYADVIVGAPSWTNGEDSEGHALVYHGSADGLSAVSDWQRESNHAFANFGFSVSTAGDINGDGYADVIVGAPYWANGENDEGSAWVYHGSEGGLHTLSDWHAEGNQAWGQFGRAVGSAGDVNGDGYADVLVGASGYNNPTESEGMAFLYYGNGSRGASLRPHQMLWSLQPLAHLGQSDETDRIIIGTRLNRPFGRGGAMLEIEVKPLGVPFDGSETYRMPGYMSPTAPNTTYAWICSGLEAGTSYHWRVRWHYDPVMSPWLPAGRWVTVPWNGWNEADFRTPSYQVFVPLVLRAE